MIEDAAERITEDFARICDVSFVPVTGATKELDGNGRPTCSAAAARDGRFHGGELERLDLGGVWPGYRLLGDGSLLGDLSLAVGAGEPARHLHPRLRHAAERRSSARR
jgi:hypothetical protein